MIFINMRTMKTRYILLVIAIWGFVGCHDVTVGYLRTTYAKYGIDSLHVGVGSLNAQIEEMEIQYPPLKEWREADIRAAELEPVIDDYYREIDDLYAELEELDEEFDADRIAEIEERLEEVDGVIAEYERPWDIPYEMEDEGYCTYDEAEVLYNQYLSYFSTIEQGLPWTTATIEGVLGTEPIQYSIANVTSEGGDAEVFRNELVIYGGGRMQLPFECKAPSGKYHVSILVENEGYSNLLENVFTFIID